VFFSSCRELTLGQKGKETPLCPSCTILYCTGFQIAQIARCETLDFHSLLTSDVGECRLLSACIFSLLVLAVVMSGAYVRFTSDVGECMSAYVRAVFSLVINYNYCSDVNMSAKSRLSAYYVGCHYVGKMSAQMSKAKMSAKRHFVAFFTTVVINTCITSTAYPPVGNPPCRPRRNEVQG
jgi:hypothetical protein